MIVELKETEDYLNSSIVNPTQNQTTIIAKALATTSIFLASTLLLSLPSKILWDSFTLIAKE